MKRAVLITSGAQSVANFRGTLIRELVARGVEVQALAPDWTAATRAAAIAVGAQPIDIALSRTGMNPVRDLRDMFRLAIVLRGLAPDVALTYFAKPNIYGTLAAWLARVPRRIAMVEGLGFVFDSSGPRSQKATLIAAVTKYLYRVAFGRVDGVVFLNAEDAAFFLDQKLVESSKAINMGGIGVDLAAFAPAAAVTRPVTFLLMARLLRGKGILEYIAAARRVKAAAPDTRFVLLGDVDQNPDSLGAADIMPAVEQGTIEWPGHVDDVRDHLAAASVFVLPAWCREGLPRSTQEAAAMAKPVITTDVVGCRDTVEPGVNGFIVPGRDVAALAGAMMRFVEAPELIATMGKESRRIAEQRWDGRRKSAELADLMVPASAPHDPRPIRR